MHRPVCLTKLYFVLTFKFVYRLMANALLYAVVVVFASLLIYLKVILTSQHNNSMVHLFFFYGETVNNNNLISTCNTIFLIKIRVRDGLVSFSALLQKTDRQFTPQVTALIV